MKAYQSWGHKPEQQQRALTPAWCTELGELTPANSNSGAEGTNSVLAFGNGRSYGDSCLNSTGHLIDTAFLQRVRHFDRQKGILCAESGMTMAQMLALTLPAGWCVPVSPGTSFVTLGGAVANDVHGKNHHERGAFGNHVRAFTLVRSTGEQLRCTPDSNTELFNATIGGLGLTGIISNVEIALIPVKGPMLVFENIAFHGLDEFISLSEAYGNTHEYTVAWLDCLSTGKNRARGIFTAANHSAEPGQFSTLETNKISVPFSFPAKALNRISISAFNTLYFHANARASKRRESVRLEKLFYPLDAIGHWNRIYGSNGFYQFQCVVPPSERAALVEIMQRIQRSGLGSFLAVLKVFGDIPSVGMLSFARPGFCLALDFAYRRDKTETLLKELEAVVIEAGGAIYPAKDRLMSRKSFEASFPNVHKFTDHLDAACNSDYWQRVKPVDA